MQLAAWCINQGMSSALAYWCLCLQSQALIAKKLLPWGWDLMSMVGGRWGMHLLPFVISEIPAKSTVTNHIAPQLILRVLHHGGCCNCLGWLHFASLDRDWAVGLIKKVEWSVHKGQHECVAYHLLFDKCQKAVFCNRALKYIKGYDILSGQCWKHRIPSAPQKGCSLYTRWSNHRSAKSLLDGLIINSTLIQSRAPTI